MVAFIVGPHAIPVSAADGGCLSVHIESDRLAGPHAGDRGIGRRIFAVNLHQGEDAGSAQYQASHGIAAGIACLHNGACGGVVAVDLDISIGVGQIGGILHRWAGACHPCRSQ
jgi:hypothetical protein